MDNILKAIKLFRFILGIKSFYFPGARTPYKHYCERQQQVSCRSVFSRFFSSKFIFLSFAPCLLYIINLAWASTRGSLIFFFFFSKISFINILIGCCILRRDLSQILRSFRSSSWVERTKHSRHYLRSLRPRFVKARLIITKRDFTVWIRISLQMSVPKRYWTASKSCSNSHYVIIFIAFFMASCIRRWCRVLYYPYL